MINLTRMLHRSCSLCGAREEQAPTAHLTLLSSVASDRGELEANRQPGGAPTLPARAAAAPVVRGPTKAM